jgi:glycine/D-amino acid oxidase-like deaminating enzyme
MSFASKPRVPLVVLGAGVIGLTVAYVAACDPDAPFDIMIVARDMPGDWGSQGWASPFAVGSFQWFLRRVLTYLGCELVPNAARCHQ